MKKKLLIAGIIFLVLLVIAIPVVYFTMFQMANVPTGAMMNTIIPGDVVAGIRYFREIKRGDIFIFKLPQEPKTHYVKRVIGLPGDEILIRGTDVFVNGQMLPEKKVVVTLSDSMDALPEIKKEPEPAGAKWKVYYDHREKSEADDQNSHIPHGMKFGVREPFRVPAGHYFVMGDSRDNSLDSRYWGTVPAANFVARVLMIWVSYETNPKTQAKTLRENRQFISLE